MLYALAANGWPNVGLRAQFTPSTGVVVKGLNR